ncbi:hypothetical protein BS17DRAFT_724124 [Gyrodon lividus]|nr:hypothetical protein BS17DRAFT_724124 [Gyrodon lividus]
MDLDPIGKHCALRTCNKLDFLPIRCNCLMWFCKLHMSPDHHDCSAMRQSSQSSPSSTAVRAKCAFLCCSKPSLYSVARATDLSREGEQSNAVAACCPGCELPFCVDHRHQKSHLCTGSSPTKDEVKNEAARVILSQNFPPTLTSTSHTPVVVRRPARLPTDPKKLAQLQKVNLMKMRHKAVPGHPEDKGIAVDQRLHVNVRSELRGRPPRDIILWFRKTMVTGKALDLIADHFSMTTSRASSLHLRRSSEEVGDHVVLRNDLALSEQIEDASSVILSDS